MFTLVTNISSTFYLMDRNNDEMMQEKNSVIHEIDCIWETKKTLQHLSECTLKITARKLNKIGVLWKKKHCIHMK